MTIVPRVIWLKLTNVFRLVQWRLDISEKCSVINNAGKVAWELSIDRNRREIHTLP